MDEVKQMMAQLLEKMGEVQNDVKGFRLEQEANRRAVEAMQGSIEDVRGDFARAREENARFHAETRASVRTLANEVRENFKTMLTSSAELDKRVTALEKGEAA